jgi:FtsZ-binding cell division protein ZapB
MHDTVFYIAGGSIAGILSLWMWYLKVKKYLKEELVDPEIRQIRAIVALMQVDINALKNADKQLTDKMDQQFDSVKNSLAITNQSLAEMKGSLDLIVKQLVK